MALGERLIDPFSFTTVRLAAGAAMLVVLVGLRARTWALLRGSGGRGGP